ncbi:hypothetical protein TNCV_502611 [Trichonephila clavipes]|nr:hypothetical protein TNCV_502611 [Trichonephila clavipes]
MRILGTSRHGYIRHDAARRSEAHLKRNVVPLLYPVSSLGASLSLSVSMLQHQGKPKNGHRAYNPGCSRHQCTVGARIIVLQISLLPDSSVMM